ncbi:hypothetical protein C4K27_3429 [Pseudomonas chlororaphis subsp. chlororaphis]|nr:hypothetical protein C4K27_3429 [Pseudomonas chlororaphis subsp. chlororaphis]
MPETACFAHVGSPENAQTAWDIVVRPLPDACLPLCARYLTATAIDPASRALWICPEKCIRRLGDGYAADRSLRQRLPGTGCFCSRCRRLRSATKWSSSRHRGFSGIARWPVLRLLRSRAQASPAATKKRAGRVAVFPGSQWQVSRQPGSRRWPALVSEFDP